MFKAKDTVVCIDDSFSGGMVKSGVIYKVENISQNGMVVINGEEFLPVRFKLYDEKDVVNSPNHYIGDTASKLKMYV